MTLNTKCPCCASNNTKKLSLVCKQGSRTFESSRVYGGGAARGLAGAGMSTGGGASRNGVASAYAAPIKHGTTVPVFSIMLAGVAGLMAVFMPMAVPESAALSICFFGFWALFWLVFGARSSKRAKAENVKADADIAAWNAAWICLKCETLFDPAGTYQPAMTANT